MSDPVARLNAALEGRYAIRVAIAAGLALAASSLSLACGASGQAYPRTDLTAQVDELFGEWDTEVSPGAAVGIFKDGRIVYAQGNDLITTMFTRGRTNAGEELSYALGLELGSYRGLKTMGHGGSAVGYVAEFLQFPEQRFSVVVLSNLSSFRPGRVARQVADLYLADQFTETRASVARDRPRATSPDPVAPPMVELEGFVGDFYSQELDYVYSFAVREGSLQLELRGSWSELLPRSDDRFGWGRRELKFLRDERGVVSGFTLDAGNVQGLSFQKVTGRRY